MTCKQAQQELICSLPPLTSDLQHRAWDRHWPAKDMLLDKRPQLLLQFMEVMCSTKARQTWAGTLSSWRTLASFSTLLFS